MKIVKVTYTAMPGFAEENQANIRKVMSDLQKLNRPGINYNCCLTANGKTFIHTAFFETDQDHKLLNELPAFQHFQTALKAAGFATPPTQEMLTLVGSSKDIFIA